MTVIRDPKSFRTLGDGNSQLTWAVTRNFKEPHQFSHQWMMKTNEICNISAFGGRATEKTSGKDDGTYSRWLPRFSLSVQYYLHLHRDKVEEGRHLWKPSLQTIVGARFVSGPVKEASHATSITVLSQCYPLWHFTGPNYLKKVSWHEAFHGLQAHKPRPVCATFEKKNFEVILWQFLFGALTPWRWFVTFPPSSRNSNPRLKRFLLRMENYGNERMRQICRL